MRKPSPAQLQSEAQRDLLRVTRELRQAMARESLVSYKLDEILRASLLDLLHRDVIRIGHRPTVDAPTQGQITIEEALDDA